MNKYELLKSRFENVQDSSKAISMSKYMKDLFMFYGIPSPIRKEQYKDILKEEKKNKKVDWNFLHLCFEDEHREFQYFVLDYLYALNKYLNYEDIDKMMPFIKNKQWWDTIDFFDRIIGNIGLRDKRVNDLMMKWSTDEDMWLRRISIDHQLSRKEKTDTELLEKILVNNFGSDEFFINKAIGWALRDYSKTNREWVYNFIHTYRNNMSSLSIREGSKYI